MRVSPRRRGMPKLPASSTRSADRAPPPGSRPPVILVLVRGAMSTSAMWDGVVEHPAHNSVAVDLAGRRYKCHILMSSLVAGMDSATPDTVGAGALAGLFELADASVADTRWFVAE